MIIAFGLLSALCSAQSHSGHIIMDASHPAWFRYSEGGPFYMCGPGDPEDFLYRGVRNADGTRNGDQMALINKMAGTGANCIYLQAIRSHGGDGDATHNPYVNSDLSQGLDQDILEQWETWFTAMDDNGIVVFFILYDDSAQPFGKALPANGRLSAQEVLFIDGMVSRFHHHKHLIWCVAEEYAEGLTAAHVSRVAERIQQQDAYGHPVAIHQNNGTSFDFNGDPNLNQFAVQWNVDTPAELHAGAVAAWNNVNGLKNINLAEFQPMPTGDALRQKIWAIGTGGAYSMILFMDIASTPVADLQTCGRLVQFMEATRFNEASPHDELARGDTDYVLAKPGSVYIAYGDAGANFGLDMAPGHYVVKWYDPLDGTWVDQGPHSVPAAGTQTFAKPVGFGSEAALYLALTVPTPATSPFPADFAQDVPLNATLSWTTGVGATLHRVSFGLHPDDLPFQTMENKTVFDPGRLDASTTYFWRIDEANSIGTTPGPTWQFTTGHLPGDTDGDADIDQEDYGRFQACFSGPGGTELASECLFADFNDDDLVDEQDWMVFRACMSGANIPADPGCQDG